MSLLCVSENLMIFTVSPPLGHRNRFSGSLAFALQTGIANRSRLTMRVLSKRAEGEKSMQSHF
jgi:hypothetical protein